MKEDRGRANVFVAGSVDAGGAFKAEGQGLVVVADLPPMEHIEQITSIHEARALLQQALLLERQYDNDLEQLVCQTDHIESQILSIEDLPSRLKEVEKEARGLAGRVSDTCTLAEQVSSKVRELDLTRERLKTTIHKVNDIIDVKNCVNGVKAAMEKEDYETAASHIQRYLNIDKSVLEEGAAMQLKTAEHKLKDLVKSKLEEAIRAEDQPTIMRFCKLHSPLGLKEEGLLQYAHYLRRLISREAEHIMKHLKRPGKDAGGSSFSFASTISGEERELNYGEALMHLFEFIAHIVDELQPIVEANFGGDILEDSGDTPMLLLIKQLQLQCDVHATKIIDAFIQDSNLLTILNKLPKRGAMPRVSSRTSLMGSGVSGKETAATKKPDPRDLAEILDTIAVLSQRTELYDRFIRSRAKASLSAYETSPALSSTPPSATSTNNEAQKSEDHHQQRPTTTDSNKESPLIRSSLLKVHQLCTELNGKVQELMSHYIALEEYFMVQSVKKAVEMDEATEDHKTSSMIDYVFFVLRTCAQRALSTCNIDSLCAIINLINTTLAVNFREVLQTMLVDYSMGRGPTSDQKTDYMLVLNNLEVSSDYIVTLKQGLETECQSLNQPTDKEKIKSCLNELVETSQNFKQLLQSNLEQVATTIFPSIRPLIELFQAVNYNLEETEYAEYEINDPFVQKFIAGLDNLFAPFKSHLTESNYDRLVHIVIRDIVGRMEKALLNKQFNQLGALQFDKDLRLLVNYFSNITQSQVLSVRGEFARLNQMASLLNLETVNEVLDYWGENAGQVTWRLTPGEVRKVLSRRVEFKSNAIAQLKL
ncbi:Golgi transport complex subunit 4 [Balamuthia mandrillaris]